jgi:hypothetical protein
MELQDTLKMAHLASVYMLSFLGLSSDEDAYFYSILSSTHINITHYCKRKPGAGLKQRGRNLLVIRSQRPKK